jgi:hypothetical protein
VAFVFGLALPEKYCRLHFLDLWAALRLLTRGIGLTYQYVFNAQCCHAAPAQGALATAISREMGHAGEAQGMCDKDSLDKASIYSEFGLKLLI